MFKNGQSHSLLFFSFFKILFAFFIKDARKQTYQSLRHKTKSVPTSSLSLQTFCQVSFLVLQDPDALYVQAVYFYSRTSALQ